MTARWRWFECWSEPESTKMENLSLNSGQTGFDSSAEDSGAHQQGMKELSVAERQKFF
jgi:hypothetical protein